MSAEIGTMKVTEQIDALRALGVYPVDYLVVPRLLALHIVMPLLTIEAITMGIGAGYFVGVVLLGIDPVYSWHNMLRYTDVHHLVVGLSKALVFGGIVALIGCYKGMTCGEGAEGVGRATTEAVVYSSITILIVNFFLTMTLARMLD
jgi:phospholipid/cholesterol/gamma-HCH transport system permease protein